MSSPTYTVGDILNMILGAVQDLIGWVASAISENAQIIANVVVLGGLVVSVAYLGRRAFRAISGWLRGFF